MPCRGESSGSLTDTVALTATPAMDEEIPMVQKVHVKLIDDLDGSDADETVSFGLDGATYEIDLTAANAARLREELASWLSAGRRTSARAAARSSARSTAGRVGKIPSYLPGRREQLEVIRAWGRSNGYAVSDRGRISAEVQRAYDAAH